MFFLGSVKHDEYGFKQQKETKINIVEAQYFLQTT